MRGICIRAADYATRVRLSVAAVPCLCSVAGLRRILRHGYREERIEQVASWSGLYIGRGEGRILCRHGIERAEKVTKKGNPNIRRGQRLRYGRIPAADKTVAYRVKPDCSQSVFTAKLLSDTVYTDNHWHL